MIRAIIYVLKNDLKIELLRTHSTTSRYAIEDFVYAAAKLRLHITLTYLPPERGRADELLARNLRDLLTRRETHSDVVARLASFFVFA